MTKLTDLSLTLNARLPAVTEHPDGIADAVASTSSVLTDAVTHRVLTDYNIDVKNVLRFLF